MNPLKAVADRWLRHGLILSAGLGFSLPYFRLFNQVQVEGDEILDTLPHRNVVFLSNHQTYFMEAVAFFDLVYIRHGFDLEDPMLRFSAAEETMKKNLLTMLFTKAGGVTFRRSFREEGRDVNRPVDLEGVARVEQAIRDGLAPPLPRRDDAAGRAAPEGSRPAPPPDGRHGRPGPRRRLPEPPPPQAAPREALQEVPPPPLPAARPRRLPRGAVHRGRRRRGRPEALGGPRDTGLAPIRPRP